MVEIGARATVFELEGLKGQQMQIEHYLTLALEQAYRLSEKPVTAEVIAATMAPGIHWSPCSYATVTPPGR